MLVTVLSFIGGSNSRPNALFDRPESSQALKKSSLKGLFGGVSRLQRVRQYSMRCSWLQKFIFCFDRWSGRSVRGARQRGSRQRRLRLSRVAVLVVSRFVASRSASQRRICSRCAGG